MQKFDKVICNGVIYDRDFVLKSIEEWISRNVILQFGVIRVVKEVVQSDLSDMFGIEQHFPGEYRERGYNGINFLTNLILECGIQSGREEEHFKNIKDNKEKDRYIAELEERIKELEAANTISVKKTK